MAYGRPMKNKTRRVPVTVHVPFGMIEDIDAYVKQHAEETETAYSRSDFYNEAAVAFLQSKGIEVDEEVSVTKA